jgi:hypothetical protein
MIALFLEDEITKFIHSFYSTDAFEQFLKENDIKKYIRVNLIFYLNDEINMEMTKIYKKRYLQNDVVL